MEICLTTADIDSVLPNVKDGLHSYLGLQSRVATVHEFYRDGEFRRKYNFFYRIRRNAKWQDAFYELMGRATSERLDFRAILEELRRATNRCEASFASKLVATLDTSKPVIDSMVLKNVGLRLPSLVSADRVNGICTVYGNLVSFFDAFLDTTTGEYLVNAFNQRYPEQTISNVKMLDLILWQWRRTPDVP